MTQTWTTVESNKVHIFWICPECSLGTCVLPNWSETNGAPVCLNCDVDMVFDRVEVLTQEK